MEEGLCESAQMMNEELQWNLSEFHPCDNVDLPLIFMEYLGYYHMRFHRRPKFCKKQVNEAVLTKTNPRNRDMNENHLNEHDEWLMTNNLNVPKYLLSNSETKELVGQILKQTVPHSQLQQTDWDHIIGHEEAKLAIEELAILPMEHPQLFSKCGLQYGTKSILLAGPPGTGKTSLVKCLASKAKFHFMSLSSSSLVSKWRGDSEKLISIVFEVARHNAPTIVFLDEAESILGNRLVNGEHEASKRSKSELLVQLDGMNLDPRQVIFIAATNMPWSLDPGFLRRFIRILEVPLPNQSEREQIISRQFHNVTFKVDVSTLLNKTDGFSGADLVHVCDQIKLKLFRQTVERNRGLSGLKGKQPLNLEPILRNVKRSTNSEWNKKFHDWSEGPT
ncbi:hypothetical protein TCAL_08033 [Tigriopus californicus]|uniref:AAA+ ATPase domain-containing protein n=2 Tax=Tigriopus californicus TaxID=6832 RepID=A0A553NNA5_TIGCA|nr:hypothetical protein TCAL_08033 [Tigriopus californicus]|eukprot:TCALIF_08033-PA protein Name:"Similar to katnal2 Katanin p60 ATPase-containing subunit A-like 2 (Xenopus tropicalis)" AED:0.12 eAED:0.12 QI:0/0/0/1/1/1/4/0/390